MDTELEQMNSRNAAMAELVRDFGREVNGIKQDGAALLRWLELGGNAENFQRIDARHFAGMTPAQQQAFVRGFEVMNGK